LCVYPFVRSYEWYLLPDEERRDMLAEHGRKGTAFTEVLANTVASFALGDYEWLLGLESDNLLDLVDMMRDLRYTDARRHVREELPFFTGRRLDDAALDSEILEVLS
jgi:chlorite dismutase